MQNFSGRDGALRRPRAVITVDAFPRSHASLHAPDAAARRPYHLRQRRARFCFHERDVRCVDAAIEVDVGPEIRIRNRLARLQLSLADIGRIDRTVTVRISKEKARRHHDVRGVRAITYLAQG